MQQSTFKRKGFSCRAVHKKTVHKILNIKAINFHPSKTN